MPKRLKRTYYTPFVKIALRVDDKAILEQIRSRTGCGRIHIAKAYGTSQAQARWSATSLSDCLRLIEILDAHPLRAKKARDYAIWREAVLEKDRNGNTSRLDELVDAVKEERRWKGGDAL